MFSISFHSHRWFVCHLQVGTMLINRVANTDMTWHQEVTTAAPRVSPIVDLTLDDSPVLRAIDNLNFIQMKRKYWFAIKYRSFRLTGWLVCQCQTRSRELQNAYKEQVVSFDFCHSFAIRNLWFDCCFSFCCSLFDCDALDLCVVKWITNCHEIISNHSLWLLSIGYAAGKDGEERIPTGERSGKKRLSDFIWETGCFSFFVVFELFWFHRKRLSMTFSSGLLDTVMSVGPSFAKSTKVFLHLDSSSTSHDGARRLFSGKQLRHSGLASARSFVFRRLRSWVGRWQWRWIQGKIPSMKLRLSIDAQTFRFHLRKCIAEKRRFAR